MRVIPDANPGRKLVTLGVGVRIRGRLRSADRHMTPRGIDPIAVLTTKNRSSLNRPEGCKMSE
jgi:hypothetical protein